MPASNIIPGIAGQRHDTLIIDTEMYKKLGLSEIMEKVREFDPDLIHFFWSRYWLKIPEKLKSNGIKAKLVVDFRSPILLSTPQQVARRNRVAHRLNAKIHGYFSTTLSVIEDNIGIIPKHSFEYFVGINKVKSNVQAKENVTRKNETFRLVIVSTLHPKRNIGYLMFLCTLANLVRKSKVSLDIIGGGENSGRLKFIAKAVKPFCKIQFLGVLNHDAIFDKIKEYDAGITHLPFGYYTDAPALKTFEYFAAGIPVIASNTNYHKRLLREGFHLSLYNNNAKSFLKALQTRTTELQVQKNQNMVTQYEWKNLFNNIIEPAYEKIVKSGKVQRFDTTNRRWRDRVYRRSCQIFCRLFRLSY